jgi:hypothetical protein
VAWIFKNHLQLLRIAIALFGALLAFDWSLLGVNGATAARIAGFVILVHYVLRALSVALLPTGDSSDETNR